MHTCHLILIHPLHTSLFMNESYNVVYLIAVGGLTSPVKGPYTEPLYITNKPPDFLPLSGSSDIEEVITAEIRTKLLDTEAEEEDYSNDSKRCSPCSLLITEPNHKGVSVPELELIKLERGEFSLISCSYMPNQVQG